MNYRDYKAHIHNKHPQITALHDDPDDPLNEVEVSFPTHVYWQERPVPIEHMELQNLAVHPVGIPGDGLETRVMHISKIPNLVIEFLDDKRFIYSFSLTFTLGKNSAALYTIAFYDVHDLLRYLRDYRHGLLLFNDPTTS